MSPNATRQFRLRSSLSSSNSRPLATLHYRNQRATTSEQRRFRPPPSRCHSSSPTAARATARLVVMMHDLKSKGRPSESRIAASGTPSSVVEDRVEQIILGALVDIDTDQRGPSDESEAPANRRSDPGRRAHNGRSKRRLWQSAPPATSANGRAIRRQRINRDIPAIVLSQSWA